jgi:steroid 5-alpha reductase family enzyme
MWKTVIALLVTIIVIPFIAFRFDDPLTASQSGILTTLVAIYLVASLLCFLVSTIADNYSQVDKLWSTIPMLYVWLVAWKSGFEPRLVLMAILVTAWGIRLTYNFSRRGGYSLRFWSGEEDYRWAVLRAKPEFAAKWKWVAFNFIFVSFYQMGLILLMTIPAVRSMGGGPLGLADYFLAALLLGFIVIETVADQQQWNFHKEKQKYRQAGKDLPEPYSKGFVHTGLWGVVRHPNYASEQAIWIVFYFFSVAATGQWINWSVMGAILLVLLFWGSSNFSESISAGKYPEYADYLRQVPRFVPFTKGGEPVPVPGEVPTKS